jgi:hypothetical protein
VQHYGSRLATRLSRDVDQRLRLHALLQRRPLSHVLDHLLDTALPSRADLRRQLGEGHEGDNCNGH